MISYTVLIGRRPSGGMYVDTVKSRRVAKDGDVREYTSVLLRRSVREGGQAEPGEPVDTAGGRRRASSTSAAEEGHFVGGVRSVD
jgi:hypothetical protein